MRDLVEHQIWWQLKIGSSSSMIIALDLAVFYHASRTEHWYDESIVYVDEVVEYGSWNEKLLRELLLEYIVEYLLESIDSPSCYNIKDKSW